MDENGYTYKSALIQKSDADNEDMAAINKLSIAELSAKEVFTFKIVMCDNKIDRTFEAFDEKSLKQLSKLFVGKTVIKDHSRMSDNQIGRIYATYLSEGGGQSDTGEKYLQLVAKCYMLKSDANADLIADINGGIKKEVSVGFRLGSAKCSICGKDNMQTWCAHWPGKEYEKELCYFLLGDIKDAYELSFVAVPTQPAAGATKSYAGTKSEPEEVVPEETPEEVPQEEESPPDELEKSLDTRMRLMGAFLFSEGEINEQENA